MAQPADFASIQTKTTLVARYLRKEIISGRIPVGMSLRQEHIAQELGLSSTPVREALRILEAEGFVRSIPHQGVRVAERDASHIEVTFELRRHIEGLAAQLAAEHIQADDLAHLDRLITEMEAFAAAGNTREIRSLDFEFHELINQATGVPHMQSIINYLWAGLDWSLLEIDANRLSASIEEHRALLEALRAHDGPAARNAMVHQIDQSRERDLAMIQARNHPSPSSNQSSGTP